MKHILILLICLSFTYSYSQEIYNKGAIIQLNGDTLKGMVGNLFDSKSVQFKENNKKKVFSPSQIKGFIYEGNTYLSKYININSYEENLYLEQSLKASEGPFLDVRKDILPYKDSVFLHLIISGKINLYEFTSRDNFKSFYGENSRKIIELPPPKFTVKKDSTVGKLLISNGLSLTLKYNKRLLYVDSLNSLMTDSTYYYNISTITRYNLKDISDRVYEYNTKFPEYKTTVAYKKKSKKVYLGFLMGGVTPTNTVALGIFALFPSSGTNKNLSYRLGYHTYGYGISCVSLGLRYATVRGFFRPYAGTSLTMLLPYAEFPMLVEIGGYIPIKKTNLFIQGNVYPPFGPKKFGFQIYSYSLGLMF